MRIVVLGAGGKLGRLLRPRWPTDAVWTTRDDVDINDTKRLTRVLTQADAVFCLAGATHGAAVPMAHNIDVAQRTLDAAQGAHVFLFSSAAVYGALSSPRPEAGPTSPQSAYATAKLKMEEMAATHPNPCTCLRLGNVAGADAILGGWAPGFQLDQYPDGNTPARSYIGPGTLAHVLVQLTTSTDPPAVLNIAAPGTVAMGDLLDAAGLRWTAKPATDRTIGKVQLDTTQLERMIRFEPKDSTAAGIVADWRRGRTQ
ncbi:NAD(P)-dependent oxidoreductase [uncultured Tateyamaria sp.]|uniref:NAD-dependent epimerase/dehydratase family protein n=1 Tax=uncultured Tateyamaria sp. TaxID=455651 RepID=UPI00261AE014|nr:NAD(P)-dependent oxidoreductase [uncultured Tateyamaria sp.]